MWKNFRKYLRRIYRRGIEISGKNDNERKDRRKSFLKGSQEDFFNEASRLRKKCNKKKEKFVERKSRKKEKNDHMERING